MCEIDKNHPNKPMIVITMDHAHFQGNVVDLIGMLGAGIIEVNEMLKKENNQVGQFALKQLLKMLPSDLDHLEKKIPSNS